MYDITDKESFTKVRKWVKELRKIVGSDIIIVVAGNKCDLERQVTFNSLMLCVRCPCTVCPLSVYCVSAVHVLDLTVVRVLSDY